MAKPQMLRILLCAVVMSIVKGQTYTVQDIADMQNQVIYELFDYFHFSQERQLTTAFEKLKQIENRLLQAERALGIDGSNAPAIPGFVRPTSLYRPDPQRRPEYDRRKPPQASRATAFPRELPVGRVTAAAPRPPTWAPPRRPQTTLAPQPPTRPPYAKTCAEIHQMGYLLPDIPMYSVDPLNDNNLVNVVCEKSRRLDGTQTVYTVIGHSALNEADKEILVSGHEDPGSFSLKPVYDANKKQLKAMTAASRSCEQFIAYRCQGSVLMQRSTETGTTYGWWETIDGDRVESWGGAPFNSSMCACGVRRRCVNPQRPCNCDANKKSSDEGFIMDKQYLPVSDVRLGDTGGKKEKGFLELGPLRCEGLA